MKKEQKVVDQLKLKHVGFSNLRGQTPHLNSKIKRCKSELTTFTLSGSPDLFPTRSDRIQFHLFFHAKHFTLKTTYANSLKHIQMHEISMYRQVFVWYMMAFFKVGFYVLIKSLVGKSKEISAHYWVIEKTKNYNAAYICFDSDGDGHNAKTNQG